MKKLILFFAFVALSTTVLFSQGTATLRLEMPDPLPAVGENFLVGLWLDELSSPVADNFFKSGQIYLEFDETIVDEVPGPPPFFKLYQNPSAALSAYNAEPAANNPPDQLIYVLYTTVAPGVQFSFFGGLPHKLWDIEFTYLGGGDIDIQFGTVAKLNPVAPGVPGGKLSKGETKLTVWNDDVLNLTLIGYPPPTSAYVWTGAVDEDWDNPLNWNPNMVPGAADDVAIPNVAKAVFPTIYGSAHAAALIITAGAQLNIAPMADLTTHGTFTNNGLFVVESNGMANPGNGESGSFIDMAGIAAGTGVFEFQRDITNSTPNGAQDGWHFISSPLPGGELTSDDLHYYYLNWFDNATQLYVPIEGSATLPCTPAATVANGMMQGWSIKYDDQYGTICQGGMEDYVVNMMGTSFNTGAQSAAFGALWNLMGNPYPSTIDPDLVTWPAGLNTNTVYMWDGWSNSWVLGANGLGNNIPPAQGFFVDALAGGSFALTGAERIHDPLQWWWKGSSELLRLRATVQGADNYADAYIRFNEASTTGLDKQWDANKRYAGTVTPEIYTTTGGLELALNTQPETDMVPMSFVCGTAGTYTIEAVETGTFSYVVLEDLVSGVQTNLLESAYTFDYTNVDEVNNFIVHFAPLGIGELNANSVKIWSLENNIIVNVPAEVTGEIAVYNMMGQEVVRTDIEGIETQITVSDVNVNYVVKVISDSNAVTGKVYVK